MDCSSHKLYHVHEIDSRAILDTYLSDKQEMVFGEETLKFPMEKFHYIFNAGHIKGEVLYDISFGSFIHHLYSACVVFKEISVLRFNEKCIMELNKWLHMRTGAFVWDHASTYIKEMEGKSGQCQDKEIMLKMAIKHIVKCDIEKENLTDSLVLPQADCVISACLLEAISKDQDDYLINFKKFTSLLKPGGHLILQGTLNATYFTAGQDRFHIFKYDENYLRKVLTGEGFIVDHCDVLKRKAVSDLTDYEAFIFITAHREK
ncbi:indolethylamine N-methyltransferase-like [Mixophyes fleayi]|uniref:indolethylamine N-methyltransferase-like n=1 Tax=Mixophyes fleayi TaxID=3061075 RepID=UPI003F4D8ABC